MINFPKLPNSDTLTYENVVKRGGRAWTIPSIAGTHVICPDCGSGWATYRADGEIVCGCYKNRTRREISAVLEGLPNRMRALGKSLAFNALYGTTPERFARVHIHGGASEVVPESRP